LLSPWSLPGLGGGGGVGEGAASCFGPAICVDGAGGFGLDVGFWLGLGVGLGFVLSW
jgi:hypothetical protein